MIQSVSILRLFLSVLFFSCNSVTSSWKEFQISRSCLHANPHCLTLVQCLRNSSSCFSSNSIVSFSEGTHFTDEVTGFIVIRNKQNLLLQGAGVNRSDMMHEPLTKINCSNVLTFAFLEINNLSFSGIGFYNCGAAMPDELRTEVATVQTKTYYYFFEQIKVALLLVNVYNLTVNDLHINDSDGYGLFILNVLGNSSIVDSKFTYNNWRALERHQYNPNYCKSPKNITSCAGGNAMIVFQDTPNCLHPQPEYTINIEHCEFSHGVNFDYELWNADIVYLYSAGGLSIFCGQTEYSVYMTVDKSELTHNLGHNGANAVVYLQDFPGSDTYVIITNSLFSHGNSDLEYSSKVAYAGGLYIYEGSCACDYSSACRNKPAPSYASDHNTKVVHLLNDTFTGNYGFNGGAIFIESVIDGQDPSNRDLKCSLIVEKCAFSHNTGFSATLNVRKYTDISEEAWSTYRMKFVLIGSVITHSRVLNLRYTDRISVTSSWKAVSSAVYFNNLDFCLFSDNYISNNYIVGMALESQTITLFGKSYFVNNTGKFGGAIKLHDSRMILQSNAKLYVLENSADLGGGIFIENIRPFLQPFCFLDIQQTSERLPPYLPEVNFANNSASVAGNSIYGGYLDECVIMSLHVDLADKSTVILFRILNIPWSNSLTEVSSSVYHLCFCKNGTPHCEINEWKTSAYPGQTFKIPAVAVGQMNGTVPAVALSEVDQNTEVTVMLDFQLDAQQLGTECGLLTYQLQSIEKVSLDILMQTSFEKTQNPTAAVIKLINVNMTRCPLGFYLKRQTFVCDCIPFLQERGIKCFIDDQQFQRTPPVWIGYLNETGLILAHNNCPLDYCSRSTEKFKLVSVDGQCQFNHSGILCGQCEDGLSVVFGSSKCKNCSNSFIALVLAFVLAGFALVLVLIYCNLTVADGSLNAVIFYANIVRIHHRILFPSGHINPITVIIAWINLDLGIEFCFYDGFDTYARTWLQFVFPAYVWLIIVIIIISSWYSTTAAKIVGSNSIPVLATLLLLSYTKLQRTVLECLSFTVIETQKNDTFYVWLYDGNVPFISIKHAFLMTVACLFLLVFIIPFTVIVLCGPIFQMKCSHMMLRLKLSPINDAYQGPYKVKYRWWTGIMLLVRSLLLFLFGVNILGNPRVNLLLIVSTCVMLLGVMWNIGTVYKNKLVNLIESFYIINLAFLAGWSEYNRQSSVDYERNQAIIVYIFTGLAILVLGIIVIARLLLKVKQIIDKHRKIRLYHVENEIESVSEQELIPPTVSYVEIGHSEGRDSSL